MHVKLLGRDRHAFARDDRRNNRSPSYCSQWQMERSITMHLLVITEGTIDRRASNRDDKAVATVASVGTVATEKFIPIG